ncbi:MAG: hypothetical protein FWH10_02375 [Oscillospiraceae bacterium]|nr:hypothetical protein [Oscillospiraceae bacterium]
MTTGKNIIRIIKIIKDESGASLMYVLGITMLLLFAAVSVLTAASANLNAPVRQNIRSKTLILEDSIHGNIMYSLQSDPANPDFLSAQIVKALYNAEKTPGLNLDNFQIELEMQIENFNSDGFGEINITLDFFPEPDVRIYPAVPEEGEAPGIPETAYITANMAVTLEIKIKSGNGGTVKSRAFYEYTGGKLTDGNITGYGKWELTGYEKTE